MVLSRPLCPWRLPIPSLKPSIFLAFVTSVLPLAAPFCGKSACSLHAGLRDHLLRLEQRVSTPLLCPVISRVHSWPVLSLGPSCWRGVHGCRGQTISLAVFGFCFCCISLKAMGCWYSRPEEPLIPWSRDTNKLKNDREKSLGLVNFNVMGKWMVENRSI